MTQRPKGLGDGEGEGLATRAASPAGLWDDWVTIWQSELNAMAADREQQQVFVRMVGLWADGARAAGAWLPDGAAGRASAASPAGAAAPVDAPDARDLALARLAKRVEELERRLAGLDGRHEGGEPP